MSRNARQSPGDDMNDMDYLVNDTKEIYLADKRISQDRSGYPLISDEELQQTAVDEKLPSGSQSY